MATAVTTFPTMALSKTKKKLNQTMWVATPGWNTHYALHEVCT